jgi:hypothetical protein
MRLGSCCSRWSSACPDVIDKGHMASVFPGIVCVLVVSYFNRLHIYKPKEETEKASFLLAMKNMTRYERAQKSSLKRCYGYQQLLDVPYFFSKTRSKAD